MVPARSAALAQIGERAGIVRESDQPMRQPTSLAKLW
jgi:hypothetical protein